MLMINDIINFAGRDPYDCSHCSGGVCDPATGACVKGNFDHFMTGAADLTCFNSIHFDNHFNRGEIRDILFQQSRIGVT